MEAICGLSDFKFQKAICELHGEYESKNFFKNVWTPCPVCHEEQLQKETEEYIKNMSQETLESWRRKIGNAGIPVRFQEKKFSNFKADTDEQKKSLEISKLYAKNFKDDALANGQCIVFCGKPGTGKTHLSCAIGMQIMHFLKLKVLFTTVYDAVMSVKETWSHLSEITERHAVQNLVTPELLILDEVGVQFGSESEKLILFNVINKRYENKKPTILISNEEPDVVKNYLGERIWDRLKEGNGQIIEFNGKSMRGSV